MPLMVGAFVGNAGSAYPIEDGAACFAQPLCRRGTRAGERLTLPAIAPDAERRYAGAVSRIARVAGPAGLHALLREPG